MNVWVIVASFSVLISPVNIRKKAPSNRNDQLLCFHSKINFKFFYFSKKYTQSREEPLAVI